MFNSEKSHMFSCSRNVVNFDEKPQLKITSSQNYKDQYLIILDQTKHFMVLL